MKIEIAIDEKAPELQIAITCNRLTPEIEKVLATLRMMDKKLTAKKNGETYLLDVAQVIYMEAVERKCFVYTKKDVYESDFKLYEMEEQLEEYGFIRVSKACLVHLNFVKSLKADLNRRILITLSNGEQIIASRQYAEELKKRLGVK